jgi:hypothetical protein
LLATLSVAYFPIFLGRVLYFRDIGRWLYPARWFVRDALANGDSTWWNPGQGLGFAIASDPLYGNFYPPNLLYMVGPLELAVTWVSFVHLFFGAVGVLLLARRFELPKPAPLVAAAAWSMASYTSSLFTVGLMLQASVWIPWCAVGFIRMWDQSRSADRKWIGGAAAAAVPVALVLLLSEPFIAILAVGSGLAFAVLWGMHTTEHPVEPGAKLRRILATALALALALGVAAAAYVPALLAVGGTERSALTRHAAEFWSITPLQLLEVGVPGIVNGGFEHEPEAFAGAFGRLPFALGIYLGGSVLALALAGLGRQRRRSAWILFGLSVFTLCLSLGRFLPLHQIVRVLVPPLAYMRTPEKYFGLTVLFVSILAALGVVRILSTDKPAWRRTVVLALSLVTVGVIAPVLFPAELVGFVRHGAVHASLAVGLVLLVQLVAPHKRRMAGALLVAIVAIDLGVAALPLNRFDEPSRLTAVPRAAQLALDDGRGPGHGAQPRLYRADKVWTSVRSRVPSQVSLIPIDTLHANTSVPLGIAILPGYDAALPALQAQILAFTKAELVRFVGADYALLSLKDPTDPPPGTVGVLEPVAEPLPGSRLYRVNEALPRVFVAGTAEVLEDDQAFPRLLEDDVVSGARVLLAPGSEFRADPSASRAQACELEKFSNAEVVATCTAERSGVAVFVEQWDPGWSATVDGEPASLLRANIVMRAVALEPGTHRIVLSYRVPGLRGSMAVSAGFLALLGLCFFLGRRAKENDAPDGPSSASVE